MKICILGSGAYGIALGSRFIKNNNQVVCYSNNIDEINSLNSSRVSDKLNNYVVPECILFSSNLEESVIDSDLIVFALPAKSISSVCELLKEYVRIDTHYLIATKGIINDGCLLISEVVKNILNTNNVSVISGPTFAVDIVCDAHISFSLGSKSFKTKDIVYNALKNNITKIECLTDVDGIEVCGAIKNVMAIISGILGGIGVTDSTKSFFLTEALHDIKDLIVALNGSEETILSYAGVGDTIMTCTSKNSRNYTYGELIGKGKMKEASEYKDNTTVEGLYTLNSVKKIIADKNINMPIIDVLCDIIDERVDRLNILDFLINK